MPTTPIIMAEPVFRFSYVKTIQGVCKIVEIIVSLLGVFVIGFTFSGGVFTNFVIASTMSIIVAALSFLMCITRFSEQFKLWNMIQFCFHITWFMYYLIAVTLIFIISDGVNFIIQNVQHAHNVQIEVPNIPIFRDVQIVQMILAGIFGTAATLAHIADAMDNFKQHLLKR